MEEETALSSQEHEEAEEEREKEEKIVIFLGSLDGYITLLDSLSETLRKGWLDLASARHSMGSSLISSSLLDLKAQSAATSTQVFEIKGSQPEFHYKLSKWGSLGDEKYLCEAADVKGLQTSGSSELRHRGSSNLSERTKETYSANAGDSSTASDNHIQRGRAKSLSVFGTLVSPKLRSAQVSFETALETIVEIANLRSSRLSAYSQLQKGKVDLNGGAK